METTTETESETRSLTVALTVEKPLATVWSALMTPAGNEALLGAGGRLGSKSEDWNADDGTCGVTRSFHPMEQIRFSWHADEDAPRTIVDLRLSEVDGRTQLDLKHEQLQSDVDLGALSSRWDGALSRIAALG